MLTLLGVVIAVAGLALLLDVGGSARWLIRNLTSRSLGELAPGYAASRSGMRAYAVVLVGLGVALAGVGVALSSPLPGLVAMGAGAVVFLAASAVVVAGEIRTYAALKRR